MRRKWLIINISMLFLVSITSCSGNNHEIPYEQVDETGILLRYLETNGEIINSPLMPSFVEAEEILENQRASNFLVIDVRTPEEYLQGHIENSINVEPHLVLWYFEQKIHPSAFSKIILVCGNSHLSGYVNSVLLTLGYSNVYTLRFGLSSWDMEVAEKYWLAGLSDQLLGKLHTESWPKARPGKMNPLKTGYANGYDILRNRAAQVLQVSNESMHVHIDQYLENPDDYYLISYWPEEYYQKGHIHASVQYDPKKSLHSTRDLFTLPANRKIVIYCYTGQHSSFVTPILRMLGYDVYNLPYGANSFIHTTMRTTQAFNRYFSTDHVRGFPLVKQTYQQGAGIIEQIQLSNPVRPQGGC
jgi:rhodanese-related sulfurtransferase